MYHEIKRNFNTEVRFNTKVWFDWALEDKKLLLLLFPNPGLNEANELVKWEIHRVHLVRKQAAEIIYKVFERKPPDSAKCFPR